ncbi:class I SAM-dependent methyltransferase [Aeromicrobium sp. Leaf350]|uniref:class I SAM-dependent methyltransferase n=1 Tax=Aeromicrobium sp. Leaf350 TaxID=2876565 RepID=UPI001E60D534|nr:class I SAM-dependent methyltransferase [Aeromicrobium sp. Leaf350]
MPLLNEGVRDKILHAIETPAGSRFYKGANNAWRSIAGPFDGQRRSRRIAELERIELEGIVNQEQNVGWVTPDKFEKFPTAALGRHQVLRGLQEAIGARTYLEIGIDNGASLSYVDVPSIGVDPAPNITYDLGAHIQVHLDKSDDFFAKPGAVDHFDGVPLDFAFIDGMHLSEFALRDFMNLEKLMSRAGVIVFDDMLPRNDLEAYRIRRTNAWAGDVYKVMEILEKHRPDLLLLPLNSNPTGTLLITNLDPSSRVLDENYDELEAYCTTPDPQVVAPRWKHRVSAVDPRAVIDSGAWALLRESRGAADADAVIDKALAQLRSIPTVS